MAHHTSRITHGMTHHISGACCAWPQVTEVQLVCTALTRLAEDDDMATQIRQCNGVTLLGKLLLVQPLNATGGEGRQG